LTFGHRALRKPAAAPAVVALPATAAVAGRAMHLLQAGRLGTVRLFPSPGDGRFVVLFSAPDGWSTENQQTAETLAAGGSVVAGIDLLHYRHSLAASGDGCHYVVADLEELSHQVERRLGFTGYRSPILVSAGPDSALAYAALSQSPAATVGGAISLGFDPDLATPAPLCPGAASSRMADGRFRYRPDAAMPGWWRVVTAGPPDRAVEHFVTRVPNAQAVRAAGSDAHRIAAALATAPKQAGPTADTLVRGLPLVELPARHPKPIMAIILSGDGGWRDIDKQIGGWLRGHGVSVIGLDSLRYFWRAKPPEQVAADLDRVIRAYQAKWGIHSVVLVGYSFGADVLPFAVNRLAPDVRASVVQVSLLGLAPTALFEFHVGSWLSGDDGGGVPVASELARMDKKRVQCIFGATEQDSACHAPELDGAERRQLPGDHHFGGNYQLAARTILDAAIARAGPRARVARAALPGIATAPAVAIAGRERR
jgi:type IV secretory pathway VirJ component